MRSYTIYKDVDEIGEETEVYPLNRLNFNTILKRVRVIQQRYPKRLLCGSTALILYDAIHNRPVDDIDFVMFEEKVVPNEVISLKFIQPYEHCLFLSQDIKRGKTINGIRLQDLSQIIYWKEKYGRPKDIKDLEKYNESQFITHEDMRYE